MSLLGRLFGIGSKERSEEITPPEPSEEKRLVRELKAYVHNLSVPTPVRDLLLKEIASVAEGRSFDSYSLTRARMYWNDDNSSIDEQFIFPEFSEKMKELEGIANSKQVSYWITRAEEDAEKGYLLYIFDLDNATQYATCAKPPRDISADKTRVKKIFQDNKWSTVPLQLEAVVLEAVRKIAQGKPQEEVYDRLSRAEEYAQALGYTLRLPEK